MPKYMILRSELPRLDEEGIETLDTPQEDATVSLEVVDLDEEEAAEIRKEKGGRRLVETMPIKLIKPMASADSSSVTAAWGLKAIGAEESPYRGAGVSVAVLDTGIDATHPAFEGLDPDECDFTGTGNGDRNGHGTHCAGTIFGRDVGGVRIGVATAVDRVLVGKVLDDDGRGDSDMMFTGMKWAIDRGANVISMSVGFDFPGMAARMIARGWPADLATSAALETYRANLLMFNAIMELARRGVSFNRDPIVVGAAGNQSRRSVRPDYRIAALVPAASDDIVSVAALGQVAGGLKVADFSNSQVEIAAPGVGILSAGLGGGLCAMDGTSMACPHVAGAAALWWEALMVEGGAGGATVRAKVIASALNEGIVDAKRIDVGMGLVRCP